MLSFGAVAFLVFALLVEFRSFLAFFAMVTLVIMIRLLVFLLLFPLFLVVLLLVALVVMVALLTLVELMEDLVTLFQAFVIDETDIHVIKIRSHNKYGQNVIQLQIATNCGFPCIHGRFKNAKLHRMHVT